MWRDKYEGIARELRAIYYADYLIDKHNDVLTELALASYGVENQEECFNVILERINKICRLQIFYSNNNKLLYNHRDKDIIIKYLIEENSIPKNDMQNIKHRIYKFCIFWEQRKIGKL